MAKGATKLIEVQVAGAASDPDARKVAMAIANSPLVKTAVAGEDANWGRIVMAVGKIWRPGRPRPAGRAVRRPVGCARDGARVPDYSEPRRPPT